MDANSTLAVAATAGTAISAVAAVFATVAAFGSRRAALKANEAADAMVRIERHRRHDELAPEFDVACIRQQPDAETAFLTIALVGGRLPALDAVVVTILNEPMGELWMSVNQLNPAEREEAAALLWSGWEFAASGPLDVVSPRQSSPLPFSRIAGTAWRQFTLVATEWPPPGHADWVIFWSRKQIRILLTCYLAGHEPWLIQRDVAMWPPPDPEEAS